MSIQVEQSGDSVRVRLAGELTIYSVAETKAALAETLSGRTEIEVDLSAVTEIDTAGLQLMLLFKRNPGKDVRFVNHPACILRLVCLANLGATLGDPLFIAAGECEGVQHG